MDAKISYVGVKRMQVVLESDSMDAITGAVQKRRRNIMTRLTARNKDRTAYFPECFKEPCCGFGCQKGEVCEFMEAVCGKLAEFEDIQEHVRNIYKLEEGSE